MKTPDLTPAQILAFTASCTATVFAVGLPLSEAHCRMIVFAIVSVSVALIIGDSIIRFGRALMSGRKFDDEDLGLD